MPGQVRWATDEQTKFLVSHFSEYVDIYNTSKAYGPFWAKIKVDWLNLFPLDAGSMFPEKSDNELTAEEEGAVGIAIKKLTKQIKDWFRWRVNPAVIVGGRRGRQKAAIEIPGRMRQLKPEEMYSKMFYKSKIKPRVDRTDTKNMAKGEKLNLVKKLTREMYEAEEESVKLQVLEKLEERAKSMEVAALDDEATPEQYHRAIQELPHTVSHFINGLERRTGWAFTILMGGPDPHLGGEISVGSCHAGLTPDGSNFADSFPNFDAHYQAPFTKFLSGIYPESVRKSRALHGVEDHSDSEDDGSGSDGKGLFRGLINANGDRVSPTAPALPAPKTASKTKNAIGTSGSGDALPAPKTASKTKNAISTSGSGDALPAPKTASKMKNAISPSGSGENQQNENQHPANNLVQDPLGWDFHHQMGESVPLAADSINGFCQSTDISSLDVNFGSFNFSNVIDNNSGSNQGRLMDLLMNDTTFPTFPSYAPDLGHDMGLFPGQFLSTNTGHLSSVEGPTFSSHLHPTPSLQFPSVSDNPSPTHDLLSNVIDTGNAIQTRGQDADTGAPNTSNTFSDLSGGQISLEAGPSSADVDRTLSLQIECPPTTPLSSLASGFGDLSGGQISSTVGPATAIPEAPPPAQFPSKAISSNPPLSLASGFGDLFGIQMSSAVRPATANLETPLPAPLGHGASSASPPSSFPLMEHISPPIATASHVPFSLSRGLPSPTLPGTTTSGLPSLSPTVKPSPLQGATEALPNDKRRSGRALVPSKRLEAMHEIGSNVPKGLPPTEQPPEKENFNPQTPPEWTTLAREHLLTRDLGSEWKECVNAWLELEARLGYGTIAGTKNALPAVDLRPEEWNKWVNKSRNGRRKYEATPTISDSAEFGIALTKWWHGMQPDFRKCEQDMPLSTYTASTPIMWDPLRKAGPNGMVSVLTMAVWWGQSLAARTRWQDDSSGEWKAFIIDVQRTLLEIAKTTIERKKRGAPKGVDKKSKRTKV